MKRLILLVSVSCHGLIQLCGPTWSEEISSADVNIVSLTGSTDADRRFVCEAVINNRNDDDAQSAVVIMLLPLQVTNARAIVKGGSAKCSAKSIGGYDETVVCQLGNLAVNAQRTVHVSMNPSTAAPNHPPTCGAYIYSESGDIDKSNNYAYWGK